MNDIIIQIEECVLAEMKRLNLKKEQVLNKYGVDPGGYRRYKRENWFFSPAMLKGLSQIPGVPDYKTLLKLRAENKNPELKDIEPELAETQDVEAKLPEVVKAYLEKYGKAKTLADIDQVISEKEK